MPAPALELRKISRRFGAVVANRDVDFTAEVGRISALVGENGAGKSTLMHIAFGLVRRDAGEIRVNGKDVPRSYSPQVAMKWMVGMVHQHFMLVENMTVAENIVLGREPTRGALLDRDKAHAEISAVAKKFGLAADAGALIEDLSVGEKQRVEILKALWRGCDVLILDEPTAVLTPAEVTALFVVLRKLAASGVAIIIITHKLDEVFAVADDVTVMRRGAVVGRRECEASSPGEVAALMVGRPVLFDVERGEAKPADVVLEVRDLSVRRPRGDAALTKLSLKVRAGEIVGVAGVEGNGQSELAAAIAGLARPERGSISLAGSDLAALTVAERRSAGLALVTEDRHGTGLVLDMTIAENLILGRTAEFASALGLDAAAIERYANKEIAEHDIRPTDAAADVRTLSGGNQQKVVIARELGRQKLKLLVASQPTRGVDIGAIERIHNLIVTARDAGLGILLLSAELAELRALSDRLLVFYRGEIAAELNAAELAEPEVDARIGALMTGARGAGAEEEE